MMMSSESRYVYQALDASYSPELSPLQVFDLGHDTPRIAAPPPAGSPPPEILPLPVEPPGWLLVWALINGIVEQAMPSLYQS